MYDLEIIKNKYGEKMSHLCRDMFSIILDQPGVLSKILIDNFDQQRFLCNDIVENKLEDEFKNYIFNLFHEKYRRSNEVELIKPLNPSELLDKVGYLLYECNTEEDIQRFKKYYVAKEELCTFKENRLNRCHVFFAIKKDVENIKRENFSNPKRQDEYGMSVISIQFTKDPSHTISIKNRYNHVVVNPDATFSNDLDNIVLGLTNSFEKTYGLVQSFKGLGFEMPNYVRANDGKYYKYNKEINNIYYCSNNIIIDNFEVKKYPKERYIVFDYFILDMSEKKILLYDEKTNDSFPESIGKIRKVDIVKSKETGTRKVILTLDIGENIVIEIDQNNNLIGLTDSNLQQIGDNFLYYNTELKEMNTSNLQQVGDWFLFKNTELKKMDASNLRQVGDGYLSINRELRKLDAPNLQQVGLSFLLNNKKIDKFNAPNLQQIGDYFLHYNTELRKKICSKIAANSLAREVKNHTY